MYVYQSDIGYYSGLQEWKKKTRLLEHSRFAWENYEPVMQVDEDSRRRKHEMKHHMETLYSLLMPQETKKAAEYIEKTLEEASRSAKLTYSGNIVLNSIVGIRLDMEGGGERHPGEPLRTLELFVSKPGKQKTLARQNTTQAKRNCSYRYIYNNQEIF